MKTARWSLPLAAVLIAAAALGAGMAAASSAEQPSASITHDGDILVLHPAANQTVRGTTDLDPGTEVSIRVRSSASADHPFLEQRSATVGTDDAFAATFDLRERPAPSEIVVEIIYTNESSDSVETIASIDGAIRNETTTTTATTTKATPTSTPSTTTAGTTVNDAGQPGFGILAALCGAGVALLALSRR